MMRRRLRAGGTAALAAGGIAFLNALPIGAMSASGNLAVTALVVSNCVIGTGALDFGLYDPMLANASAPRNAMTNVSIACTKGSSPSITMDLGRYANGGTRYMRITTTGLGDSLRYELYQPPSPTPGSACSFPGARLWGLSPAQTFMPTQPTSHVARSYNVCGTIPAGQGVSVGAYADTVVATVNF